MAINKSGNLQNLLKVFLKNILSDSHNYDRVMFSFPSYELTDDKKKVFFKGLNFLVKPGVIESSEFLLFFELLFRKMQCENFCNNDISLIKLLLGKIIKSYQIFLVLEIHLKI